MNMLNSIIVEGQINEDYEVLKNNEIKFSLYFTRCTKVNGERKEEVNYFDVVSPQNFAKKIQKGRTVRIVGRLKQEQWETTNGKQSKIYIVADYVEVKFLPTKESNEIF